MKFEKFPFLDKKKKSRIMLPLAREVKLMLTMLLPWSSDFVNFLSLIFTTTQNSLTSKTIPSEVISPLCSLESGAAAVINKYLLSHWILWGRCYCFHFKDEEPSAKILTYIPQSHTAGKEAEGLHSSPSQPFFEALVISIKLKPIVLKVCS